MSASPGRTSSGAQTLSNLGSPPLLLTPLSTFAFLSMIALAVADALAIGWELGWRRLFLWLHDEVDLKAHLALLRVGVPALALANGSSAAAAMRQSAAAVRQSARDLSGRGGPRP